MTYSAATLARPAFLTPNGTVRIRAVDPAADDQLLHAWLTSPHAHFWGATESTLADIHEEYERIQRSSHEQAVLLELDGMPYALVEVYDPFATELADVLPATPDARGMHFLVAPRSASAESLPGLTSSLFSTTVRWIFEDLGARCLFVEPDARNERIHAKNHAAGFTTLPGYEAHPLTMGGHPKTARIQRCTPESFASSALASYSSRAGSRMLAPYPALPEAMHQAQRELIAKTIRELVHERMLSLQELGPADAAAGGAAAGASDGAAAGGSGAAAAGGSGATHRVAFGPITVCFRAIPHALEHWSIAPESLVRPDGGALSLPELIASAAPDLKISPEFLHTYLAEVQATLAARARVYARPRPSSRELSGRDISLPLTSRSQADLLQRVEGAMVEGHPSFIANSGRGGMGEAELHAWAPELSGATPLVWLAARHDLCTTALSRHYPGRPSEGHELWRAQLGETDWARFAEAVRAAGYDPADYLPLPVHPWQWNNRVTTTFASDLALGKLIYVGKSSDLYRPQQSLRTFFNFSRPEQPYIKTAVAVRNMGFLRGLSSAYMSNTPAINDWLHDTLGCDPEYRRYNVRLLKEVATVGYVGDVYHATAEVASGAAREHLKMLAALWRQSPIPELGPRSIAVTLASVLHGDDSGRPLVGEWIAQSGLRPRQWVGRLLDVYLRPALHALAAYGIAFMPHGENVILELTDGAPTGSFFKDLGEEVTVVDKRHPVPAEFSRIMADHGEFDGAQRALSLHTDILDGVLRHLAALLADRGILAEETFWAAARECVERYERDYPGTLDELPMLSPRFKHSCLNRLQMRNPLQMVDLSDQNASLIYAGDIDNPLAGPGPR